MSPVGRMTRMYGTVIRVPSAVPVDSLIGDNRIRYTAGGQPYVAVR